MHFYATREDLSPVLQEVEGAVDLKYIRFGSYPSRSIQEFSSASEIQNLGVADKESAVACRKFLVLPRKVNLVVREPGRTVGGLRYTVDQLENPVSVVFAPGGMFGGDVLLYGRFSTVSRGKAAQQLLRRFDSRLRKYFVKIGAFYVGPEAQQLKANGVRLTMAVQSPLEYNLA
jgi:hypothetical protein